MFPEREERWKKPILSRESPPPHQSRRHWPFCRGSKSSPRGECLPTQTGLILLSVGRQPPMWACAGPALGFLRARCSWSTLNKGNSNVTATVNLLGCSCQQDVPNQSRNNPTSNTTFFFSSFFFVFPPAPSPNFPRITKRAHRRERAHIAHGFS